MCTSVTIKTNNGDTIHGRTEEFGIKYNSDIILYPKNYDIKNALYSDGGKSVKAKHRFIGINAGTVFGENASDVNFLLDGMNDNLSLSAHLYPNYNEYKLVDKVNSDEMEITAVPINILGTCDSLDDIYELVNKYNGNFVQTSSAPIPGKFFIVDKNDNSIVIEPNIKGELEIVKGNGVCTNSPTYNYLNQTLGMYSNIQQIDMNLTSTLVDNNKNIAVSHGVAGAWGLPGDTSPESRFVRGTYYKNTSTKTGVDTAEDGVLRMIRIMHNFDIVPGFALRKLGGPQGETATEINEDNIVTDIENTVCAHTDHTLIKDISRGRLYYSDYNNPSYRYVELEDTNEVKMIKVYAKAPKPSKMELK